MKRQVFRENWQAQLDATIAFLTPRVAGMSDGRELIALSADLKGLQELRRQVSEVLPADRQLLNSLVLRMQIDEPLSLPADLVRKIGELFDVYRRFRTQLGRPDSVDP